MEKITIAIIIVILISINNSEAQINRFTKPIENTLETDESSSLTAKLLALKIKNDKLKAIVLSYKQYYNSIESFKNVVDGRFKAIVIVDESLKGDGYVSIINGRVTKLELRESYDVDKGLMITSKVKNAHNRLFLNLNDEIIPVDVYLPDFFFD